MKNEVLCCKYGIPFRSQYWAASSFVIKSTVVIDRASALQHIILPAFFLQTHTILTQSSATLQKHSYKQGINASHTLPWHALHKGLI